MSENVQMRTRLLPSLTNWEVEDYLKRNDIIFVPVGVCEMHGTCPLDIEYAAAEAYSRIVAEMVDGLVLPNLVYFTAGGTMIGKGTVYMNIENSCRYLYNICYSLLVQGFRRIVLVPAHGDSCLIINSVISQFFDDTKCPMLFLQPTAVMGKFGVRRPQISRDDPITKDGVLGCSTMDIGIYQILNRIDDIPTGEFINNKPGVLRFDLNDESTKDIRELHKLGNPFGMPAMDDLIDLLGAYLPTALYFDEHEKHGSTPMPWTKEEIYREGEIGAKVIREMCEQIDWNKYLNGLRTFDKYMNEIVVPRYAENLPRNRYSPNTVG